MASSIRRFVLPATLTLSLPLALSLGAGALGGCGGDDAPAGSQPNSESDAATDAGGDAASEPESDAGHDAGADAAPGVDASARGTVAGKILSDGENAADVKVVIGDKSATTDANGAFSIDDVAFPYTLHVVVPATRSADKKTPLVWGFAELSTPNPVVEVSGADVTHSWAKFTGKIVVQDPSALTPNSVFHLVPIGAGTRGVFPTRKLAQQPSNGPIPYNTTLQWPLAKTSTTATLVALVYTYAGGGPGPGIPTNYTYASSSTVLAKNEQEVTDPTFPPLVAVGNKTVAGSVEVPSGYTIKGYYLYIGNAADELNRFIFSENKADLTFSYAVPDLPSLNAIRVEARAQTADGAGSWASSVVTAGTSGIKLVVTKAPEAIAPAANAAGVKPGDLLSWSSESEDCLYTATLMSENDGATYFTLTTTETQIAIPDLAAYGGGLTASTPYEWLVSCAHQGKPKPSIDDAVKFGGTPTPRNLTSTGPRSFLSL